MTPQISWFYYCCIPNLMQFYYWIHPLTALLLQGCGEGAGGERQSTPLDEPPAHHWVLSEHLEVPQIAQGYPAVPRRLGYHHPKGHGWETSGRSGRSGNLVGHRWNIRQDGNKPIKIEKKKKIHSSVVNQVCFIPQAWPHVAAATLNIVHWASSNCRLENPPFCSLILLPWVSSLSCYLGFTAHLPSGTQ